MSQALTECERIVNGLLSYCHNDRSILSAAVSDITYGTIQYILDGAESLDDLEACEKTVFGTKFEKRFVRHLGLPHKTSRKRNPHGLKLDTRVDGLDLDFKTTLGGNNWMVPGEAVGSWLFLVQVDPAAQSVGYGLLKADPENLTAGKNQDKKASVSKIGKQAICWIAQGVPYAQVSP